MGDHKFSDLRVRLLKGGVAPKHVRRTIGELGDHVADLTAELVSQGFSETDARREALARIGSDDAIAQDILAKPELKSWGARWPWAVYGLGPVLTLTISVVLLILLLVGIAKTAQSFGYLTPEMRHLTPTWVKNAIDAVFYGIVYGLPLFIAATVCRKAVIHKTRLRWLEGGLLLLCVCAAALDIGVTWPTAPDVPGALVVGFSLAPPFPAGAETAIRAVINIGIVGLMLRIFKHRAATY